MSNQAHRQKKGEEEERTYRAEAAATGEASSAGLKHVKPSSSFSLFHPLMDKDR